MVEAHTLRALVGKSRRPGAASPAHKCRVAFGGIAARWHQFVERETHVDKAVVRVVRFLGRYLLGSNQAKALRPAAAVHRRGNPVMSADRPRECRAIQYSDEMHCPSCRLRWDTNDPEPPPCGAVPVVNTQPAVPAQVPYKSGLPGAR